jgi:hypothetical protein
MPEIRAIETRWNGEIPKPARGKTPINHAGKKFGHLTAVSYSGRKPGKKSPTSGNALWLCTCDCGNETVALARDLIDGTKKSCGCLAFTGLRAGGSNRLPAGESAFNCYFYGYKKSARQRSYEWDLTKEQFKEITSSNCHYCGIPPSNTVHGRAGYTNGGYKCNGVDRINNEKGYVTGNVRPCCKQCNIAKGVLTEQQFYNWIGKVANHHIERNAYTEARSARFEQEDRVNY